VERRGEADDLDGRTTRARRVTHSTGPKAAITSRSTVVRRRAYHVPTLAEINAVQPNGYVVASTFAGCGGSSLGYRMAGFRVGYANEFVDLARDVYRANARDWTHIDGRDVRDVQPEEILEACGGIIDVLDGSPPCASFSMAGKRSSHWGEERKYSDTKQRTDDLFGEYVRLLDGIQPPVFVAENVRGLTMGVAKGKFKQIYRALQACGYNVAARIVEAEWLGVPQMRQRLIFIGTRADLNVEPRYPDPFGPPVTCGEAIGDLDALVEWREDGTCYDPEDGERIDLKGTAISRVWRDAYDRKAQPGGKYRNLRPAHRDEPAPTIVATGGNRATAASTHWTPRSLTLAEVRRICSFPDDFSLSPTGDRVIGAIHRANWERMGRAVPPLMMRAVATSVLHTLQEAMCPTRIDAIA
jgi:DNA (cytosine-5)-methyltransferase 1